MKTIILTQGKVAKVDDKDYAYLSRWEWCFSNGGYAKRGLSTGQEILMHQEIIDGQTTPEGICVDHIDEDKLNNTRHNLRRCRCAQLNDPPAKKTECDIIVNAPPVVDQVIWSKKQAQAALAAKLTLRNQFTDKERMK